MKHGGATVGRFIRLFFAVGAVGALLCSASGAHAIVLNIKNGCIACGYVVSPLNARSVHASHRIRIEASCANELERPLPELRLDDGRVVESTWVPAQEGHPAAFQRYDGLTPAAIYDRVGPSLPPGEHITLGTWGPATCWFDALLGNGKLDSTTCGVGAPVDCCAVNQELAATTTCAATTPPEPPPLTWTPKVSFWVAPLQAESDAGAPANADASPAEGIPTSLALSPPKIALRCAGNEGARGFLLDMASPVHDSVIAIRLLVQQVADDGSLGPEHGEAWQAPPCLGQNTRDFHPYLLPPSDGPKLDYWLLELPNSVGTLRYRVEGETEDGLAWTSAATELNVPQDCVSQAAIELTWQGAEFSQFCAPSTVSDQDLSELFPETQFDAESPALACSELFPLLPVTSSAPSPLGTQAAFEIPSSALDVIPPPSATSAPLPAATLTASAASLSASATSLPAPTRPNNAPQTNTGGTCQCALTHRAAGPSAWWLMFGTALLRRRFKARFVNG